jgi:two-component system CheB/CheR fusion protein
VAAEDEEASLELVLERIRSARNVDFRNYKRATLRRRIERRMNERKCQNYGEYIELLERDPAEVDIVISAMLIKVTRFFRDEDLWEHLTRVVVPELIMRKRSNKSLRVWCAGCATGEEAFSVAILLGELLGPALHSYDIRIFGTDVDEAAVAFARRGTYSAQQVQSVPKPILEKWFVQSPEGYTIRKDVRRLVVFGVNNLVSDAPISRLDMILCRNVFIYHDAELQRHVITRFHYALQREGVLVLGKSELIPFASKIFIPLDLSRRIYRKDVQMVVPEPKLLGGAQDRDAITRLTDGAVNDGSVPANYLRDVLDSLSVPVVATGLDGDVKLWNPAAARLWARPSGDVIGKKLSSLGLSGFSGDLLIEKTSTVRDGRKDRERAEGLINVIGQPAPMAVSIEVSPLRDAGRLGVGLLYVVYDVTALRTLEQDLGRINEALKAANHKLQKTNEELQSANEELETTNEELQSANEELQTTNEELQSTNEELETTNEELQSTNAELDATNRELAHRTEEMNILSLHQKTLIRSLSAAVVVLDPEGQVTTWNMAAERLLGIAEAEAVGQVLWSLRLPALSRPLLQKVRAALREGRAFRAENVRYELTTGATGIANIAALPLVDDKVDLGAVLLFEDMTRAVRAFEQSLKREEKRSRAKPSAAAGVGWEAVGKRGAAAKGRAARGRAVKGSAVKGSAVKGSALKSSAAKGSAAKGSAVKSPAAKGPAAKEPAPADRQNAARKLDGAGDTPRPLREDRGRR